MSRPLCTLLSVGFLVLGLAACGDGQDAAQSGSAGGNSSSSPGSDTDTDAENADKDSADVVQASGEECLVGTWLTDNKNVGAVLRGSAGDTKVADPTGQVLLTFTKDGGYVVTYKAWTFEMSQQGTTLNVVRNGIDKGTYKATNDGRISTAEEDMGSKVSMTSPAGTHSTLGEPSTMKGSFACEGNRLEITVDNESSILNRQ